MKLSNLVTWYASDAKDGFLSIQPNLGRLDWFVCKFDLRLYWWGDVGRVLMYSGGKEMYGVPGSRRPGERAGSNPVTSDLSPHLRHFF